MKHIIFDLDGTVFDTKKGIIECLNYVLICFGRNIIPEENEKKYIGPSIKFSLINFNGFSEIQACEATELYRSKYVEKYIYDSVLYPKVNDVLECLKNRKIRISIATMKTKKQVNKLLDIFNLQNCFECIETAKDEGDYSKNDMLLAIKQKYIGDSFVFVGDTENDYMAAKITNIDFVFANYGYGTLEVENIIRINSFNEILDLIEKKEI